MNLQESSPDGSNDAISRKAVFLLALWVAAILLFYGVTGFIGVRKMRQYRAETQRLRQTWFASQMAASNVAPSGLAHSPAATRVEVSVLVNRAGDVSLRQGNWETDFDIAFRWKGDTVNPGATFRLVNGEIVHKNKVADFVRDGELYERYNVRALVDQPFDASRLPFSNTGLVVEIEDTVHDIQTMRYEVAGQGIRVGSEALGSGLKIIRTFAGVQSFTYPVESDDHMDSDVDVRSRFVIAMLVHIPGREAYLSMFQALFASVGVALLVFSIKPIHVDPRFGLGVGAFFAAIGNNIYLASLLPPAGRLTLTVLVSFLGLVTIFLTLVQSSISLHLYDTKGKRRLSRFFDRVSAIAFLAGYLTVNLLLPLAARPQS